MKYLLCLFLTTSLFAASGAITEGEQYIKGKKVFDDNVPTSTTASGNITLSKSSHAVQLIDPNGSTRNVTLPDVAASKGYIFRIVNTGSGADIVVKNAAASTIATISQNQSGYCASDGVTWSGWVSASSFSGGVAASGATTGATSQAQTFTNGVVLDAITGNTATALAIAAKVGSNAVGNAVTITGGAGNGAFDGGAVTLTGGASGAGATGNGGAVTLNGTVATSTNGNGGAITGTAGAGVGSGNGGAVGGTAGAGGATGAGGNWSATAGRGGSTSGAAGTAIVTAGAGGASATTTGGAASLIAGASGAGATGNGGVSKIQGGAAASTNGTGGAAQCTGGAGTGTGSGGAVVLTGGAAGGGGSSVVGNISVASPFSSTVTTAQVLANSGTITLPTTGFNKLITSSAGAVTGIIMTSGRYDGEYVTLIKTDAGSVTFAASGTSKVADGTSAVLASLTRMTLVWDATSSLWYHGN